MTDEQAGFDAFWAAYPRKVGKIAARKVWHRRWPSIDVAAVLEVLSVQSQSQQWRAGYIPHPKTWLNEGREEDEPVPVEDDQPEWVRRRVGPNGWRPRVTSSADVERVR